MMTSTKAKITLINFQKELDLDVVFIGEYSDKVQQCTLHTLNRSDRVARALKIEESIAEKIHRIAGDYAITSLIEIALKEVGKLFISLEDSQISIDGGTTDLFMRKAMNPDAISLFVPKGDTLISFEEYIVELLDKLQNKANSLDCVQYNYENASLRQVEYIVGPTNSGKTHEALSRITQDMKVAYCAPLRLLATEVYERMNASGIPCSLLTGEEMIHVDGANMVACTVEMLNLEQSYDIVIIDEYQFLSHAERGASWTEAITRVKADNVLLIGSESHVDYCNILLKSLRPNDNITLTKKARQSDLICEGKIKYGIESIKKGDAVVFFSKAKVENFASQLVEAGYKVSILYGDMPLENRKKQAEAFANGITDILVTTDVIGYGLNLPIERVVFGQISKSNGIEQEHKPLYMPEPRQITGKGGHKPLSIAEVQQIAGRAGRGIKNGSFAWFDFLNGAETYAGISLLDFEKNAKKINSVVMHDEKNFYFKANLQDFANYATKRKRRIYIYAEYFLLNSLALSNVQAKMIAVNPFTRISLKNIKCPELIAFANFNKLPASKNAKLLTPQCELYSPKKGYNGQLLENELGSLYRSVLCKAHDENKLLDFLREIDRFEPSKKDKALRLMLTVFNALGYDTEPLRAKRIQLCEKLNEELIEENILAVFEARREVLKNTLKHKRDYLDTLVNNAGILEKLNKISENGELETLDKLLNTLKLRENVTSLKELEMFSELVALNVVDISHFPLIKQILDDTSNREENIMMFFKQLGVTWRDWFAITEQWSLDPSVRDFISHFHHFITIFQMLSTSLKAKSDNQCLISTAYNLYFCLPELLAKIRTDSRRIEIDFDLDMVQQMYEQMVLDGESDIEQSKAEVNTKLAELNTEIRKIKRKLKLE